MGLYDDFLEKHKDSKRVTESVEFMVSNMKSTIADYESALMKHGEVLCDGCRKCVPVHTTQRCSGCKRVYYCSRKCQKKAWKYHKSACGLDREPI